MTTRDQHPITFDKDRARVEVRDMGAHLDGVVVVRAAPSDSGVVVGRLDPNADPQRAAAEIDEVAVDAKAEVRVGRAHRVDVNLDRTLRQQHRLLDALGPVRREPLQVPGAIDQRDDVVVGQQPCLEEFRVGIGFARERQGSGMVGS